MKSKTKKRKIRYDRILIFIIIIIIIISCFTYLTNLKISNIYISNNIFLTDQQIIEIADISDYPKTSKMLSSKIKNNLENSIYIKNATVKKRWLTQVYIDIEENRPLFYYESIKQTVLLDGRTIDDKYNVPTVINYVTDVYFNKLITEMAKLDLSVLIKIAEIEFKPNEVDDNRFLLTMTDGNYVYVNIETFNKLNKYLSIKESLPNKKGILYLDYGNNFEIIK